MDVPVRPAATSLRQLLAQVQISVDYKQGSFTSRPHAIVAVSSVGFLLIHASLRNMHAVWPDQAAPPLGPRHRRAGATSWALQGGHALLRN